MIKNCHCGKEIRKERKYCSFLCRSDDAEYCKKISDTKSALYSDPIWKSVTESKKIQTTQANYGVNYPMQDLTIFKKQQASCFKKDKNGLHGYEPYVYPLLKLLYRDIMLGTDYLADACMSIRWFSELDNKTHGSYPDFFSPALNSFIEIKSQYTYGLHKDKIMKCKDRLYEMCYGYIIIIVNPGKRIVYQTYNRKYINE